MTQNEIKLLDNFLEVAEDAMGNADCNDFVLPNTPENYEMVQRAMKGNLSPGEIYTPYINSKNEIVTMDFIILSHLRSKLKAEYA